MNTHNPWIAGGNGLLFTVSRLARPRENVSAREWFKAGDSRVTTFNSLEKAAQKAKQLNKHG